MLPFYLAAVFNRAQPADIYCGEGTGVAVVGGCVGGVGWCGRMGIGRLIVFFRGQISAHPVGYTIHVDIFTQPKIRVSDDTFYRFVIHIILLFMLYLCSHILGSARHVLGF